MYPTIYRHYDGQLNWLSDEPSEYPEMIADPFVLWQVFAGDNIPKEIDGCTSGSDYFLRWLIEYGASQDFAERAVFKVARYFSQRDN